MKTKEKIYSLIILAAVSVLSPGCKKWLDVNYNPRDLTDDKATPDLILPPLIQRTGNYQDMYLNCWMGYWTYWNFPLTNSVANYNRPSQENIFISTNPPVKDVIFLENKSRAAGAYYYLGIAKVIKALLWSAHVDRFNNIPYSQAFDPAILQPRYDKGQAIYEDLMLQLDSASGFIKSAAIAENTNIKQADIMFHGDKMKWAKFINTLKLRLLIHQSARTDRKAYIQAQIQKIVIEGSGFLNSGEDGGYNPGYDGSKVPNVTNPYFGGYSSYNMFYNGGFGVQEAGTNISSRDIAHAAMYAMELLKKDNDPRLDFFYSSIDMEVPQGANEPFTQSDPKNYRANQFGLPVNGNVYPYQSPPYISAVGGARNVDLVTDTASGIIKGRNMDQWVITSVESLFLQAEAVQRGFLPGDAKQAYLEAVRESFRWLNVGKSRANPSLSDAVFESWYQSRQTAGNPGVSWEAAADKYKLLMYQKYMALNGIEPLETWTDYRRNGRYPNIPVSASPARVGNTIPIRLLYVSQEYILNPAANAEGNLDVFNSKIWWMP